MCEVRTEHMKEAREHGKNSRGYFTALWRFSDFFGNYVNELLNHRLSLIFTSIIHWFPRHCFMYVFSQNYDNRHFSPPTLSPIHYKCIIKPCSNFYENYIKICFSVITSNKMEDKHVLGSAKCWLSVRSKIIYFRYSNGQPLVSRKYILSGRSLKKMLSKPLHWHNPHHINLYTYVSM